MTHSAPSIDYSSNWPFEFDEPAADRGEPRYTQKRSRRPKRTGSRKKGKPAPSCGIAGRRHHRIEW